MIRHIPHTSEFIPLRYNNFVGETISLKDEHALEIFGQGKCIIFPINRLICDVERFIDNEPMEAFGMGVCYKNNANLQKMRDFSECERKEIIRLYYMPHHRLLEDMVAEELSSYGKCLIIDCHTYRKDPWPYEDSKKQRPEIDIGFNKMTENVELLNMLLEENFQTGYNTPFQGSLVPMRFMENPKVESIMLEVRQDVEADKAREKINRALEVLSDRYYNR